VVVVRVEAPDQEMVAPAEPQALTGWAVGLLLLIA